MINKMTMAAAPDAMMKMTMTSLVKNTAVGLEVEVGDGWAVLVGVAAIELADGVTNDGVDNIVGTDGCKDTDIVESLASMKVG